MISQLCVSLILLRLVFFLFGCVLFRLSTDNLSTRTMVTLTRLVSQVPRAFYDHWVDFSESLNLVNSLFNDFQVSKRLFRVQKDTLGNSL